MWEEEKVQCKENNNNTKGAQRVKKQQSMFNREESYKERCEIDTKTQKATLIREEKQWIEFETDRVNEQVEVRILILNLKQSKGRA